MGMRTRVCALALALTLSAGLAPAPAVAGDFEPDNNTLAGGDEASASQSGTINDTSDYWDWYYVIVNPGDIIEVRLLHDVFDVEDVDIWLVPPTGTGTTDFVEASLGEDTNCEYIRYRVPPAVPAGSYYRIAVEGFDTGGSTIGYNMWVTVNDRAGGTDVSGIERYWGPTRWSTALAISEQTFPDGSCSSAVIATGRNFADALSGSGLAGAVDGPLLLVDTNAVPAGVVEELDRLGVTDVYIIGGTGAVTGAVSTALVGEGFTVERIFGDTRYETAVAVAERMNEADMYMGGIDKAFLCYGGDFPDALAASPFAYSEGIPILLTPTNTLNSEAETFLSTNCSEVYVIGGNGVVSDPVFADAVSATGYALRVWGTDRYATARNAAETLSSTFGGNDFGLVGVATGRDFPDALAGGVAMGYENGVLLLTPPTALGVPTLGAIQTDMSWGDDIVVFGGDGVVSFNALMDAQYELDNLAP